MMILHPKGQESHGSCFELHTKKAVSFDLITA